MLVGRPSLWALAGGADGVTALLRWYESELRRAMALCGAATVDDIERSLVRRAPGWALEGACRDDGGGHAGGAGGGRPHRRHGRHGPWTWREAVAEGATRGALARSLLGDAKPHVGVLLPNGPEYLFWLNGTALAGAAIVGINPTRRGDAWRPTSGPPTAPWS